MQRKWAHDIDSGESMGTTQRLHGYLRMWLVEVLPEPTRRWWVAGRVAATHKESHIDGCAR